MRIYFAVTTDLTYDQRMIRICRSLAQSGHTVTLVGRRMMGSIPLQSEIFLQKRIRCFFSKGKLFYAEYTVRLFFYLLFKSMDCICAIDLDTILPCYFVSKIRKIKRVYDAHELFCEMKEIVERPAIYAFWKKIERLTVPHFKSGYTVNQPIAEAFGEMYGVQYEVIRNIALLKPLSVKTKTEKYILYQGAVNEGRSFETLIPAMKMVNCPLIICGEGNFFEQTKKIVDELQLQEKVIFKGNIAPDELRGITENAFIGITLFDDKGLSNYYSLANRFFDYMHAGVPQLCVDYPVYREMIDEIPFAVLIKDLSAENIAQQLNNLLVNEVLYETLQKNCMIAREKYNWQTEEKKLIKFYSEISSMKYA